MHRDEQADILYKEERGRHQMMIFDGHADLLYDVTKWRQAGEEQVL